MQTKIHLLFTMLALLAGAHQAVAQGTAFTYQGQLQNNGSPASGTYNLTFSLFNANTGGVANAGPVTNNGVIVSNGLFTVLMDFGPGVFTGATNWLEIGVEANGDNTFTTLTPRQQLTPVPFATMANTASNLLGTLPAAQLSGRISLPQLPSGVLLNSETGVTLTGAFTGNGAGLTNLNATNLAGQIQSGQESTNTALLNATNTFTGINIFSNQTGNNPLVLFTPTNYMGDAANYVWQMAPANSNAYSANFNFNQEVHYFNGVADHGATWGWNAASGGGSQVIGRPLLQWELEDYYQQTAIQAQSECHLDYRDMQQNYDRPITFTLDVSNMLNWGQNSALDSVVYRVPANGGTGTNWLSLTPSNSLWFYHTSSGLLVSGQVPNEVVLSPAGTAPANERLQFGPWSNIFFTTFGGSAVVESNGSFGVFSNQVATSGSPVAGSLYLGDGTFNYYQNQFFSAPGLSAVYDPATEIASSLAFSLSSR
jgi:hypothetical protein